MPTPEELYGKQAQYSATGGGMAPEQLYKKEQMKEPSSKGEGPSLGEAMLEEAPQTVGGIAGGMIAAQVAAPLLALGPVGWMGFAAISALGAGVGGAAGKGYQNTYKALTGAEDAPRTSYDAAVELAHAGAEEAAWDLGGQLGARLLGKIVHTVRPKAVDDVEKLAVKLEKSGGQMTAAQRTDSWLVHQLDSLTRGSLTGSGRMKAVDTLNEAAIKTMEGELRQKIAKNVTENLSDRELGSLFLNTIKDGRAAHRVVVNELYSGFDELVPTQSAVKTVTKTTPTGIDPATGKQMFSKATEEVVETTGPVSTMKLKERLMPFKEQLERINFAGESADSKKLLTDIFNQSDNLSFSDAQALRSNLLDAQRNLEGTVGKSKITGKINSVVDELTKAMDEAAAMQGPQTLAKYQAIKKYASKGYKAFDNDFISDLIVANKKNPERIGEYLFRSGNVQEVMDAQRALRYAAKFGKDKGVSYDKTWKQMQVGYLDSLLSRSSKGAEVTAGATTETVTKEGLEVSGKKLLSEFTDPKKSRTLSAAFDKDQREAILEFAKVAERVQRAPQGGLGMVMQLAQGGAIIGAATGNIEPGEASVLFLSPYILAKVMTSPKGARLLATALETPAMKGRGGAVFSQLTSYVYDVQREMENGGSKQ